MASSSHACADEYLETACGEAFSLSSGCVASPAFAAARSATSAAIVRFSSLVITGDRSGVPAVWSPMRGSGESGMDPRGGGDLTAFAARRLTSGDVAAVVVSGGISSLRERGERRRVSVGGVGARGVEWMTAGVRVRALAHLLDVSSSRCFLPLRTPTMYPTTTPSTHVATATRGTAPKAFVDSPDGLSPREGRALTLGRLGSTDTAASSANMDPLGATDATRASLIASSWRGSGMPRAAPTARK